MDAVIEKEIRQTLERRRVQQLASRYSWMLDGSQCDAIVQLFARKTAGIRAEMPWGIYDGIEGVKRLYSGLFKSFRGDPPKSGQMFTENNGSYNIVIAGDGKTAKLTCEYMGSETHALSGTLQAYWTYGKRAFDLVKEDGEWKIWHLHTYINHYTPYDKGWVEENRSPAYPGVDKYPPDRPSTAGESAGLTGPGPLEPKPYETFDEKTAY